MLLSSPATTFGLVSAMRFLRLQPCLSSLHCQESFKILPPSQTLMVYVSQGGRLVKSFCKAPKTVYSKNIGSGQDLGEPKLVRLGSKARRRLDRTKGWNIEAIWLSSGEGRPRPSS